MRGSNRPMTTAEAGKLGGDKVSQLRGPEFYSQIGRLQGKNNNPGNFANRSHREVQEAGRKGGRSKGRRGS